MNSDFIQSAIVKIAIALGSAWAMKQGVTVDGSTWQMIGAALFALGAGGYRLVQAYGQRKVPAAAVVVQPAPGTPTTPPAGKTITGTVVALALICLTGALLGSGAAYAQTPRARPLICDPLNLIPGCDVTADVVSAIKQKLSGAPGVTPADPDQIGQALAKPFQDFANFVSADSDSAIALSTAIPNIQDGHGQQCWMAMKNFTEIIKAHPVPVTLKVQTDVEAFRLLGMAANQICANVHCSQVFADVSNTVAAAAPINAGLPIPTLASFCSKIPQIAQIPPIAVAPTASVVPAPTP